MQAMPRYDRRARTHYTPPAAVVVLPVVGLVTKNRDIERSSQWARAPQVTPNASNTETP